jgi:hypothetical protein
LLAVYRKLIFKDNFVLSLNIMEKLDKFIEEYLMTLSEKEKKAYDIAKEHLGMSFQIEKSNGFIKWKKNKTTIS